MDKQMNYNGDSIEVETSDTGLNSQPNSYDANTSRPKVGQLKAFLRRVRYNSGYRIRCLHTAAVVWMFITLGFLASVVGGVFPDLRLIINEDLEMASWLFTTGSIGYMIGALLVGVLFDRLNRMLVLTSVCFLNGISFVAYPWCSTFPSMLAISFIGSVFGGAIDCCGNAHVASIWGGASAPYMQAIHFGFSFGGFIGPLIAEPFVASKTCVFQNSTVNTTISTNASSECVDVYGETHVQYAFLITGAIGLTATLPFLTMFCLPSRYNAYVCTPFEDDNETAVGIKPGHDLPVLTLAKKIMFVTLLMLLISNYACIETRFSTLLTTFLADYLHLSSSVGLHVTSLFWGMFAAGRLLGILVTRFFKSETMILIYLLALTTSFITLLFAAQYAIEELVWVCTAVAGLSMSVIFPSVFTWTAESILTVTGTISSVYIVGCSVFNMLLPLLYGYLMDNFTQMYYVYLLIAEAGLALLIYTWIRCLLK